MPDKQPLNEAPETGAAEISGNETGLLKIPDHQLLRCIGRGSYGEVWLARNVIGAYRAVKIVYRRNFEHERPYEREFNGIQKFEPVSRTHEGLVDILQVGRNDTEEYFYYVMELADDVVAGQRIQSTTYEPKTLGERVVARKALRFEDCLQLGLALSSAVGHLHKHELIHRDIKPSNIIFVNGIPKLADIGLVTAMGTESIPGGTLGYIAPEGIPSPRADIYSLGKVLYEISTGKDRQEFPELPEEWGQGSEVGKYLELNEVILKACANDPRKRYQSAQALHADLVLLEAGKSVKRLRLLERRLALLTRAGLLAVMVLIVGTGGFYQAYREKRIKTRQLAESYVALGTHSMDEGDLFDSLDWFTGALGLENANSEQARICRVRIGATLRLCPKIVQMWFQDKRLNSCEFSPDGKQVVTAGLDGKVSVRDSRSGKPVFFLEGHTREVESASYSRDQKFIVTGSIDKTARVWEALTGKELFVMPHADKVHNARFNPAGDRIITACNDRIARVWEWNGVAATLQTEFARHKKVITDAAFSPDGRSIVTASWDQTAQLWNLGTEKSIYPLPHPLNPSYDNWVFQASFSPDGRFVVTASLDAAWVWDVSTGREIRLLNHGAPVRSAEFSPDGRYVVTAGNDFSVKVWDVIKGKVAFPPLKHNSYVKHASFSPDGSRVVTVTTLGVTCLWDLAPYAPVAAPLPAFFSPDGRCMVAVGSNRVEVTDAVKTGSASSSFQTPHPVTAVRLNREGERLLTIYSATSSNSLVQLWDTRLGKNLGAPFLVSGGVLCLSRDGQRLFSANGSTGTVYNTTNGQPLLSPLAHQAKVSKAAFDFDGTKLITASGTNANAYLWDLATQKFLLLAHSRPVSHVEFSPDGRRLVTACMDYDLTEQEAQVWDANDGHKIGTPLRHADGVEQASFSPDGERVVTAGRDHAAVVWEAATGRQITPRLKHQQIVIEASFSPDGRWVVTICDDNTARVWDAQTGLPITPPLKHSWPLRHAQFIGNGDRIVIRRSKHSLRAPEESRLAPWMIWEFSPDDHAPEDLVLLAQLLTGQQSDQSSGARPLSRTALRERWDKLGQKYPQDFQASAENVLAWHEGQASEAENAEQWFAACFHLDRLLTLNPNDLELQQRHAQAHGHLDGRNPQLKP